MSENITIVDKKSHAQTYLTTSDVKLVSPSVVELPLRRVEIKSIARSGDALVINTVSGEVIVIHGFFNTVGNVHSDLVLQSDDGLWLLDESSLGAAHPEGVFSSIDTVEPLLLHDDSGLGALAMILGGLGIAGGAIGLAASSGGDSDKPASTKVDSPTMSLTQGHDGSLVATGHAIPGHTVTVTWPDGSKSNAVADASGNYSVSTDVPQSSGTVEAVATDPAGHVSGPTDVNYTDTNPPQAPVVNVTPNADGGLTVGGTAEPGSTVTVTYPDGSTVSTVADGSGNYSVSTDEPQTSGTVEVVATDPAGNASDPTDVNYTDTNPPQAPVVNVTPNADGGLTVGGTAEPGSTVTVTYPDGSTVSTVADGSGNYSVSTDVPQTSGTVEVVATDPAGNASDPTDVNYTDTTAPQAPVVNVTPNADGGVTVGGTAEPGSTVTVTYPDGSTGSAVADGSGNYSVSTDVPQTSGTVEAVATDPAGNASAPTDVNYTDTTAPQAPVVNVTPNADGGVTVGGTAEPGSTVTVTYPDGSTGTTVADGSGNYSVSTDVPQTSGTVEAVATDPAGNASAPTDVNYADTTAPDAPLVNLTPNAEGGLTVSGTAEAGSTVTVTYPDGSTGTTVADASGHYSVTTDVPQTEGTVEAVATDKAGNTSAPTDVDYGDTTPPQAPVVNVAPNADGGLTVSGTAEAGSTVTVTYPDGSTGTAVADGSGNYSVSTDVPQTSGTVEAVATDRSGNESAPTDVAYTDTTAPQAPVVNVTPNADGGLTVGGTAEPGSTVTVTYPDGSTGTAVADGSGNYSVSTDVPQTSGTVEAVATDPAGNASAPTDVNYTDTTAPQAPVVNVTPNAEGGLTVGGTAEPGSTVTVTYPDGSTGTTVADGSGNYSVSTDVPQTSGTVEAVATDPAGNASAPTDVNYADTTAPQAPVVNVTPNADGGLTVSGTAEAGSTVTVTYPDGSTGSTVADASGNYSVSTDVPQTEGTVEAVATDKAGNTSAPTDVDYGDTTPPQAPVVNVAPNADGGLTVGGTAEPGSTVTVTYPDGSTVSTVADGSGNYSVSTDVPQTSGTVEAVATDRSGNESAPTDVAYTDTTAPQAPVVNVTPNADGGLTVGGTAEPGSTVTVTYPDGSTGTTVADGSGNYSVSTDVPQTSGTVEAVATDRSGNESAPTDVNYTDTTAPQAPVVNVTPNADGGLTVGGTAEPGSTVTVTYPDGSTGTTVADGSGNYSVSTDVPQTSGTVEAVATDPAGNASAPTDVNYADTTAPDAPLVNLTPNAEGGLTVSGTAEAGSTVTVTYPDGSTGSTVADASGNYSVSTDVPQTSGTVEAVATDPAGNASAPTDVNYTDTTAPQAPVVNVTPNADGGVTVGGTAEPGSTVTVTYPDGSTGTTVADGSGNYSVSTDVPQTSGTVEAVATDPAGNASAPTDVAYTDTTAPQAPVVNVTPNADGGLTVGGTAEPGSTVTVTYPDGSTVSTVADGSGNYSVSTDVPQTSGTVEAVATDRSGNESAPTDVAYTDTTAPQAPVVNVTPNADGGLTVGGTAEPGSTVTVTYPDGSTGTTVADGSGNYSVSTDVPQTSGTVEAVATDPAGNASAPTDVNYTDTTAPQAPVVNVTPNADGGLTVGGTAEPGSTVTVTYPDGSTGSTVADGSGNYSVSTDVPQTSGTVEAVATDPAGNASAPTDVNYADTTAPDAPLVNLTPNADGGLTVSGTAEAGSTVTVTYPDGSTGSTVADASGNYSVSTDVPQTEGTVEAVATDKAGNTSAPTDVDYGDTTPPQAPVVNVAPNADGGLTVSGTAEAGSTVTVTYPDGSTGTTVADGSGNYSVSTDVPQTSGTVEAVATDRSGNESAPTDVAYTDTTAPQAPVVNVTPNADGGLTVGGTAEPGSTVTVTYPDGSTVSTVADGSGNYSVSTDVPQTSGTVEAVATDPAGNASAPTDVNYTDTTAPQAPVVNVTPNADGGLTVGGTAEPGSTVTVTYPDGSTGSTVADGSGNYSVSTDVPQTSGTVEAVAKDAAGNTSAPTDVNYTDTTAPQAPVVNVTPNADGGLTVGGTAEPGSTVTVTYPDGSTGSTVADASGNYSVSTDVPQTSGTVEAVATDPAGNASAPTDVNYADTTAPDAPLVNLTPNAEGGLTVSGTAEAGSTVTVTYPDGSTGSTVADASGNYSVSTDVPQTEGTVEAVATDKAGNTSAPTDVDYGDTTPPQAPVVNVAPNADGGLTVSGTAEAGSTVTVTYPDGSTGTTVADGSGNYSVSTDVPQTSGTVEAVATDRSGNESAPTDVAYTDTTAPQAPVVNVTPNADGGLTVGGTAEPGSTVTVTYPDGSTVSTVADGSGNYSVSTDVPQTSGTVEAVATDPAGNASAPTDVNYTDTTAPQAPVVNVTPNADGGLTVGGTAEPGSTVTVTYPDGSTGSTVADGSGNYSVSTDVPQTSGTVEAVAKDAAGNTSAPTDVNYTDTTAPQAPVVNVTPNADGGLTVGGTAEPGSTVTVTYPDGSTGSTVADASGNYSVSTDVPQTSGTVEAVATDPAGNASAPTDVNYADTTAPDAPLVNLTPNAEGGLTVSGTAEAGSTVTVTYPDGSTGSTVADASGNYSVSTDVPQTEGTVEAVATDKAGNTSAPTDVDYGDTTPPQAPVVNVAPNADGGLTVSGTAEAGSTVTVTYPDGSTGTTVADGSGNYSVSTDVPQTSGTVEAVATDRSGNESAPTDVAYTDTTAPQAPVVNVTPNADGGLTVGGTAEPGSTVTVTYPDGSTGTTVADGSGNYSVSTDVPQTSGTVEAVATDPAGNASAPTDVNYADTTAPDAPLVNLTPNAEGGLTVSGTAEAGSTVTVTYPDGSTGSTVADASGNYSVSTDVPQTSGTVEAVATDPAGNASAPTDVAYTDTTAPQAPVVNVTPNADGGLTVGGTAEPGSTVTVTYPDGSTGSTVADGSGNYSVSTDVPQTSGTVEAVATDPAGNASAPTDVNYADTTAPDAPLVNLTPNAEGGPTVSGTAEAGSTVTVTYPDGSTGSTVADGSGNYSVSTDVPQTSGTVEAVATDPAGNASAPTDVAYTDTTAPQAPVVNVAPNADGGLTVSGTAEAGSTVTVTYPDGSTGTTVADGSGNYSVSTDVPQTSGTVEAVATDPAGNASAPTDVNYADTTAPDAPLVNLTPNADGGLTVSGTAEAGSTVTVTYPDGSTGTTVADGSGNYSVSTDVPQTSGTVEAVATDAAGNSSQPTDVDYADTTPPTFQTFSIDLITASDNGVSSTDNITSVVTPTFTGTVTGLSATDATQAAAGKITVMLFDDKNNDGVFDTGDVAYATDVALTMNGTTGTFNVTLPSMFDGTYNMKAVLVDASGNMSAVGLLDNNANAALVIDTVGTPSTSATLQSNDGLGYAVSSAGDVNGDGYEDFIVSAPHLQIGTHATWSSDIYVLYGSSNGVPSLSSIDNLTADQGMHIILTSANGGTTYDQGDQGYTVVNLGDINGDGYDDIGLANTLNDRVYIVFGRGGDSTATIDLASFETNGSPDGFFIKNGNDGGWFGNAMSGGDINGDGYSDVIIGSLDGLGNGNYYVLYGHAGDPGSSSWSNLVAYTDGLYLATGPNSNGKGAEITNQTIVNSTAPGYADSDLGSVVAVIGDVNGDGYNDYIVSQPLADPATGGTNSGQVWLMFGSANGLGTDFDLKNLTPSQGIQLTGTQVGEWLGGSTRSGGAAGWYGDAWYGQSQTMNSVGDINGDGIEDFAIGSPGWNGAGAGYNAPGRVYVIYGKADGDTWSNVDLSQLDGSNGFILYSSSNTTTTNNQMGFSIASAGDVNGDGIDDFLIGAPGADSPGATNSGAVYLVYGEAGGAGFLANTDIDALVASGQAVKYTGANANDFAGTGVAGGDWNGDGISDYAYGIWESDTGAVNGGAYNVYTGSIAKLTQSFTVGDDELYAGNTSPNAAAIVNGVDIISGGQGNDVIHGIGTDTTGTTALNVQHDVAMGGAGNDTIGIVGTNFTRVDGGLGIDTMKFEASGLSLNLADYGTRVKGIENFDLGNSGQGTGGNALSLKLTDVLNMPDSLSSTVHMTISGDSSSSVTLAEGTGTGSAQWQVTGTTTVNNVAYDVYHNTSMGSNTVADLLIQHGIQVH